jgi:hypothetical protein
MARKETNMDKDVFDAILGDDELILPDGWDGETDIFTDDGTLNADAFTSDGEEPAAEEPAASEDGEPEADAPTTGEDAEGDTQSADDEDAAEEPDGEPAPEPKPSRKLKLKVNHTEEELDLDAMSDEDLTVLLQKGRAYDALKDTENKRRFREAYQAQLDQGMTEEVARVVARSAAGGKDYPLEDSEEPEQEDTPAPEEKPAAAPARDFVAEVNQLRALYPDFKEVPDEVARSVAQGVPLLAAYLAYRDKQSGKTAAALKKENEILKQNAASAAKAPVTGVTGGGKATPEKVDPFLQGFDDEDW